PACSVYEECGSCKLSHMDYPEQLKTKESLVREAFAPYSGLKESPVRPILGMTIPWAYRNYVQVQVASSDSKLIAGIYAAGRIVDTSNCPIQHPDINRTIQVVRDTLERNGIDVYNDRTKQGVIRSIAARRSPESGTILLTLITGVDKLPDWRSIVQDIRRALPLVVGISQNVNSTDTPLIFGVKTNQLWGRHKLDEQFGNLMLSHSAQDQELANFEQSIKLYDVVTEAAALTGRELVIDTACGTGTFGLTLASKAREVRGVESVSAQVADARENAIRSNVTNTRFYEGQTEQLLPQWFQEGIRPDIIVLHPSRTGCDPSLLSAVTAVGPTKLIYISSNPTTLAKDCKALYAERYVVEWTQPIDISPQTSIVECCTLLVRKDI
ncbi:MAG: 23S rRNA (uracil(1939)-C(5))-methyltransferase RlmD, partial [Gorillibacterium sp.]|nr:23S rRNA (uracil(1939)-C(5))-methyltransferase RlmD [Gorillibacterium sp.]